MGKERTKFTFLARRGEGKGNEKGEDG